MRTLRFTGYGDDTFGEYGVTGQDYDNCATCKPIQCLISAGNEHLLVVGQYATTHKDGCWVIGVSMECEDEPIPNWPVRVMNGDCPYSPTLEIDVPEDFRLTWYSDGKEVEAQ